MKLTRKARLSLISCLLVCLALSSVQAQANECGIANHWVKKKPPSLQLSYIWLRLLGSN